MSNSSDEQQKPVDAGTEKHDESKKTWTDEEVRKIIEERDKAKERARKHDEDKKKADEAKAIEEGRLKEVLAQKEAELAETKKKADAYEEAQKIRREFLLSKITDDKMKDIAGELSTAKLESFVEQYQHTDRGSPDTSKGGGGKAQTPNRFAPLAGESWMDYQRRVEGLKSKR